MFLTHIVHHSLTTLIHAEYIGLFGQMCVATAGVMLLGQRLNGNKVIALPAPETQGYVVAQRGQEPARGQELS